MVKYFKKIKEKVNTKVMSVFGLLMLAPAFVSADTGQSTAVVSALETIATDIKATITAIAPVAISIVGVYLVWRYGIRFFKSLAR